MRVSWKLFGGLLATAMLAYLSVVAVGFFMPLQNDEVNWLIQSDRAWLDGGHIIGLYPQCGKNAFARPLPVVWYLPAYASYLTYGQIENPLWVRAFGIAQFFLWLSLWTAIAMKLFSVPHRYWWAALTVLLGFLGWDALPLALLVNRPEQILLIGTGTAIAMALYADALSKNAWIRTLSTFWLVFNAMAMHASHQKSIALLPLELAMVGVFLHRAWRSRAVTAAGLAAVAWIAVQSYAVWVERIACPDSAEAREYLHEQYLPVQTLWQNPSAFAAAAFGNVTIGFITNLYLQEDMEIEPIWLPMSLHPLSDFTTALIRLLDKEAWCIYLFLLAAAASAWGWSCRRYIFSRKNTGAASPPQVSLMALTALLAFIGALFIFLHEPMFYIVSLMVPLVVLAALLALSLTCPKVPWEYTFLRRFAVIVLVLSLANQALLLARYGAFAGPAKDYATLGFDHRAFSSTRDYAQTRQDIRETARQCGINTGPGVHHLVVDDTAYPFFHTTYEPLFFTHTTWMCCRKKARRDTGNDTSWFNAAGYFSLLARYDSDGLIGRCSLFPDPLRVFAREHQGLCCIPKAVILNATSNLR